MTSGNAHLFSTNTRLTLATSAFFIVSGLTQYGFPFHETNICLIRAGYPGREVDIRLHLLHITQNSLQPLRGLSHSVIIFQKAQSHINVIFVALWFLARGENGFSEAGVASWFVIEFSEDRFRTPVCRIQDITSGEFSSCCRRSRSRPH